MKAKCVLLILCPVSLPLVLEGPSGVQYMLEEIVVPIGEWHCYLYSVPYMTQSILCCNKHCCLTKELNLRNPEPTTNVIWPRLDFFLFVCSLKLFIRFHFLRQTKGRDTQLNIILDNLILKYQCSPTVRHLNYTLLLKHSNQHFQPGIHKYQTLLQKPTFCVALLCCYISALLSQLRIQKWICLHLNLEFWLIWQ